jgi:hypothetical protein
METERDEERLDKLFAAARQCAPYEPDIEAGFETRLMARIRAERKREAPFPVWAWRLVPAFLTLVILLGIWAYKAETHDATDLSAIAKIGNEETVLTAFLTGE